jgi:hypothetical protein
MDTFVILVNKTMFKDLQRTENISGCKLKVLSDKDDKNIRLQITYDSPGDLIFWGRMSALKSE